MEKYATDDDASKSVLLTVPTNAMNLASQTRISALTRKTLTSETSRQPHVDVESSKTRSIDEDSNDEFSVRFSAAQLEAKIAQTKHDAKLVADAELIATKKELVKWRYQAADRERERDKALAQCEALQKRLDAVLLEHKQTLLGMRKDMRLDELLATIDMEMASRQKLQEAFTTQQQCLSVVQERGERLDLQVAKYQKTETVLAQAVAHLQHRFASKDQLRTASVEHVQRELIEQHEQEMTVLRAELAKAQSSEKVAHDLVQEVKKELKTLRESEQQALVSRESVKTLETELQGRITQLGTEKAILQSKAMQIQKVDAQLRGQIHAQSDEIATLRQEKEALQRSNKELGEIASDLLQVAERQHAENKTGDVADCATGSTHAEDKIFLQKRKKRLRMSLG